MEVTTQSNPTAAAEALKHEREQRQTEAINAALGQEISKLEHSRPLLGALVRQYKQRFQNPEGLPPSRPEDLPIETDPTARIPAGRGIAKLTETELQILREKLTELLRKGFVRPSSSPYGAAILFVKKGDGSLRLYVDLEATHFSKFDLREGYYNLRIKDEHIHKSAFRCRYGHFEWVVVPFGLTNAPSQFSSMMNWLFRPFLDLFVIVYLDDIIVYSRSEEEHYEHLRQVLQVLEDNTLFLKLSTCYFLVDECDFCGHTIGRGGLSISPDKAEAMGVRPRIEGPRDIMSWLGSCLWFKDFVPDFSMITKCLTDLTRKDVPWSWTAAHDEAVELIIYLITTAPVLKFFDPTLETIVYPDASAFAIGGWIGQVHPDGIHPVTFWSRKMTPPEMNYPVYEQELLALVALCDKFGHMLRGVRFTAKTDHRALIYIQQQEHLSRRQARWVMQLQELDFTIEYLPGKFNNVADYLTRNPSVEKAQVRNRWI